MDKSIVVFGTLLAAFMTGIFSLFTLINNKEQKVSEFRQAWIDGLRNDITGLISALFYISYYNSTRTPNNPNEAKDIEDSHKQYVTSCASILTRVNSQDPDTKLKNINDNFLEILDEIQYKFNNSDYSGASLLSKELIEASKPLLKAEWERVKNGEKAYRKTKSFAWSLSLTGIILLAAFLFANHKALYQEYIYQAHASPIQKNNDLPK